MFPRHVESSFTSKKCRREITGMFKVNKREVGLLNGITDPLYMNVNKLWVVVKDREAWHAAVHGVAKIWT